MRERENLKQVKLDMGAQKANGNCYSKRRVNTNSPKQTKITRPEDN